MESGSAGCTEDRSEIPRICHPVQKQDPGILQWLIIGEITGFPAQQQNALGIHCSAQRTILFFLNGHSFFRYGFRELHALPENTEFHEIRTESHSLPCAPQSLYKTKSALSAPVTGPERTDQRFLFSC
jgi:hypothetical protein